MHPARFQEKLDANVVRCLACHQKCLIEPDNRGICGVRKNIDGELFSVVYGLGSSLNPDPIEKKPLYHFLPGTISISLGAYGCNFSCTFCQNHDLSQSAKIGLKNLYTGDLPPEKIVKQAEKLKCKSISYTYSEPTTWAEYTLDTIKLAREKGIKAVYVSNGYQSKELRDELAPVLDAINIDLKSFSDDFYKTYCGGRLKPVLDNIASFHEAGVHVEVTTLIIPGLNDSIDELRQIARFLHDIDEKLPWHISRFFPMYRMNDRPPTPFETLEMAYEIGRDENLKYVYLGNVQDIERSSTFCPNCGEIIIKRTGYIVETYYSEDLKCPGCGALQDLHV